MKTAQVKLACLGVAMAALAFAPASRAADCSNLPAEVNSHPHETISNGKVTAVVMLPSKGDGFYQGVRFDWLRVACAAYNGHKYWGEWFASSAYTPTRSDAVMGPAEEFRVADSPLDHAPTPTSPLFVTPGAIGYKEAPIGGNFLKPGVGFLKKVDDKPYNYGNVYPIADGGTWTNSHTATSVTSKQVVKVQDGYGYEYEKTIELDKSGTTLSVVHHLKNTGSKPIDTLIYNHDFFMFDDQPTNADMRVHFNWARFDASDLQARNQSAKAEGNDIVFSNPVPPPTPTPTPAPAAPAAGAAPGVPGAPGGGRRGGGGGGGISAQGYMLGFDPNNVKDFDITVQNTKTGVGIEETSDTPLARLYFWSQASVVCPEGYIKVSVAPGKTQSWTLHYRLFTATPKS